MPAKSLFAFPDPFSRSSTFSGLGNLGSNAFGGLGSHALSKYWLGYCRQTSLPEKPHANIYSSWW